jgi:DAK2 domain fusion protein YloV
MGEGERQPEERLERLDAVAARRWAVTARAALAGRRSEIDALNVFPVPDGDTGTNLYLTFDAALDAARSEREARPAGAGDSSLADAAAALARATLLAARGNSGVILSQMVRGLSEVVAEGEVGSEGLDAAALAQALQRASDLAYASVSRPVEGTILSVGAAAARAANQAVHETGDLYAVVSGALSAARQALAATTSQLPALERAGVVDAGGAGYVLLLEALEHVVAGGDPALYPLEGTWTRRDVRPPAARPDLDADVDADATGPEYEVMYLLAEADDASVKQLRDRLDALGDSVLVVGGNDLWNVHAHVDDAGAAIEAGVTAGRPHRIAVNRLEARHPRRLEPASSVAVVACVAGAGLADVFRAAGAGVVDSGPRRRASTGQILAAIRGADASAVLVLPNDEDTQLAAEAAAAAAADDGIEVHVVRSHAAVQGIAALAVFDPAATVHHNLLAMSSAAAATRQGAVTVADREALTSAGWCQAGDVLGVVDGDIVAIGEDLGQVGADVVDRLLASGGELLTIVTGEDAPPELGATVAAGARVRRRDVEVSVLAGGQPAYPLLLGVE